ncbi:hypothetical protein HJG60_011392 [Phyllostomus discolor]|uniref:Uncharacterized protein n=1 Tax=Phyllostomus discolor TaxID=89673 RepID=A0A834E5D6_9CHIR|nr:hypothetical protein HJG60_011392 [Phyllostomus discolor]
MVNSFLREPTSDRHRTKIVKTIFFREFTHPSDLENTTSIRKSTCLGDHLQEWVFTKNACLYPQFITTGSTNVEAQKKATRRAFVAAIFMNILSACIAAVGVLILTIACFTYEAKTHEYIWSQMAGSMLLQFLLFSAISELILAGLLVSWIVKALHRAECNDDTSLQIEEISCSIDSSGCSLSECSSIHL